MKSIQYPTGAIVELQDNDTPHLGVVFNSKHIVELIAVKDEINQKMIGKIVSINLETTTNHPITNKSPRYNFREYGMSLTIPEIIQRIKQIRPKYEGKDYHIIYNNCQHFTYELATGVRKSPDADQWQFMGGLIGGFFQIKDFGLAGSAANVSRSSSSLIPFQNELHQIMGLGVI